MISESCYTAHITHIVLILERIFPVNTPETHATIMDYVKLNSIHAGLYVSGYCPYLYQPEWLKAFLYMTVLQVFTTTSGHKQHAWRISKIYFVSVPYAEKYTPRYETMSAVHTCNWVTLSGPAVHCGSFLRDGAHLPNPLSVVTDLCWPQVMCERIINLSAVDWCV